MVINLKNVGDKFDTPIQGDKVNSILIDLELQKIIIQYKDPLKFKAYFPLTIDNMSELALLGNKHAKE